MRGKSFRSVLGATLVVVASVSVQAGEILTYLSSDRHIIHGSGTLVTETRDIASFTRIEVSIGVDLVVQAGLPQQMKITFDDNLIGKIRMRVRGITLEIDSRGSFSTESDCKIEIAVPRLDAFELAGSGNIDIHGVTGDEFEIDLAGSGDIKIDGRTKMLTIDLTGSGNIDTRELIAEKAEVDVAGSGNVKVHAEKSLNADISGSGDIRYYGDPDYVDTDVSGSGNIRRGKG